MHYQSFNNGDSLLSALKLDEVIPDILFLDLNIPDRTNIKWSRDGWTSKKLGANMFLTKPSFYNDFTAPLKEVEAIDLE